MSMSVVSLGSRSAAPIPGDPLPLLRACHERIRSRCALAVRLAAGGAASPPASTEEIAEAAAQLVRYFGVALPLHVTDEDESLAPRLRAHPLPDDLAGALDRMTREHVAIEALLGDVLLPAWRGLAAGPGRSAVEDACRLGAPSARLHALLAEHLVLEETALFPAIPRLLGREALAEIAEEIRARRANAPAVPPIAHKPQNPLTP
jgi:hypothetical protein